MIACDIHRLTSQERANEKLTTNISFHYGGVLAYRIEHQDDPVLSTQFASRVAMLDKFKAKPVSKR
jgi:hypothetical protein